MSQREIASLKSDHEILREENRTLSRTVDELKEELIRMNERLMQVRITGFSWPNLGKCESWKTCLFLRFCYAPTQFNSQCELGHAEQSEQLCSAGGSSVNSNSSECVGCNSKSLLKLAYIYIKQHCADFVKIASSVFSSNK